MAPGDKLLIDERAMDMARLSRHIAAAGEAIRLGMRDLAEWELRQAEQIMRRVNRDAAQDNG